jgi:hypothetical protein
MMGNTFLCHHMKLSHSLTHSHFKAGVNKYLKLTFRRYQHNNNSSHITLQPNTPLRLVLPSYRFIHPKTYTYILCVFHFQLVQKRQPSYIFKILNINFENQTSIDTILLPFVALNVQILPRSTYDSFFTNKNKHHHDLDSQYYSVTISEYICNPKYIDQ